MWVLIFYVSMGMNAQVVSEGNLDKFDSKIECQDMGHRMLNQINNPKVYFRCVGIVFKE